MSKHPKEQLPQKADQPPRQAAPQKADQPPRSSGTSPEESQPPRQAAPATPPEEGNVKTVQASPQSPSSGGVPEGRGGGSQVISERLVPRLRFGGFEGEWSIEKFGNICKFVRGPFGGALKKDIFVKQGYPVYEQSHAIYQNFDSFRYFITEDKFRELKRFEAKPNDIIMSCSGTMGKIAVVPSDAKRGVINQALLKLTVANGYNLEFIKNVLKYQRNQEKLLSQAAGGAIKNVVGVSQLKEIEFSVPKEKEQQKIADCLSSVDELITAQDQKIQHLNAHKKGLMQQLFPAVDDSYPQTNQPPRQATPATPPEESQPPRQAAPATPPEEGNVKTVQASPQFPSSGGVPEGRGGGSQVISEGLVPKLRFGGFEGEWKEKPLSDVSIILMGSSPKSIFYNESNNGLPLLQGNADIKNRLSVPRIYTSQITKECKVNDILLSVRAPVGSVAKSAYQACIGRGIAAIRTNKNNLQEFLYQWLISFEPYWQALSQGGTFDAVNSDDIKQLLINIPVIHEQQKIANCLSSVDELINLHTQKLSTLKAHKKGLMQQLFPAVEGTLVKEKQSSCEMLSKNDHPTPSGHPSKGGECKDRATDSNSPPLEGWQAKPDGVVNSPLEGSPKDEVVNSPLEGSPKDGVVNSPQKGSPKDGVVNSPLEGSPKDGLVNFEKVAE